MDHNKPNYEHPRPPLVSEMIILDFSAPALGMAKHGISPFPGAFFRVAFGSNPRPRGPHMGLISIPEGHKPPRAGLGCRWCVLLDEKLGSGSSIRAKSVDFQISAIGAELLPGKQPLWYLGDNARFSQQPAVPNHSLGSSSVAVVHTRPMLHTGTRPVQ